ncbi:unnamed protein product [Rotaria sordida]|uniref:DUF3638 domain-containing protein n=1 Tax=Rotaria sordida TaxID=392033 RepID=A0A814I865_9BILA|nr:unnamed protein product [Rotaria sordida]CAF3624809.1 unnamed protein product [Rotaria sordida]
MLNKNFHDFNSNHFNQATKSVQTTDRQNAFPQEIFPSIIKQDNALSKITNYFKNQLSQNGLLNRRIFPFAYCRDMNFNTVQINQIFKRIQQRLLNYDIILTSPEDILSFDLLTIDKY